MLPSGPTWPGSIFGGIWRSGVWMSFRYWADSRFSSEHACFWFKHRVLGKFLFLLFFFIIFSVFVLPVILFKSRVNRLQQQRSTQQIRPHLELYSLCSGGFKVLSEDNFFLNRRHCRFYSTRNWFSRGWVVAAGKVPPQWGPLSRRTAEKSLQANTGICPAWPGVHRPNDGVYSL